MAPCCAEHRPAPCGDPEALREGGPLTQMRHAAEARIEAHLAHLIGARQEEVNHAVCDHAAWKAEELVVEAAPLPEAVPAAWRARLQTQQLPVGSGEARDLAHRSPHLSRVGGRFQEERELEVGVVSATSAPGAVPLPCPFPLQPRRTQIVPQTPLLHPLLSQG